MNKNYYPVLFVCMMYGLVKRAITIFLGLVLLFPISIWVEPDIPKQYSSKSITQEQQKINRIESLQTESKHQALAEYLGYDITTDSHTIETQQSEFENTVQTVSDILDVEVESIADPVVIESGIANITVKTGLPLVDVEKLEEDIYAILGSDEEYYGVYVYDLKRNIKIGINEEKLFGPGSISKVPVGLLTMIEVDKGNLSIDDSVQYLNQDYTDPTNVLKADYIGTNFSIADYLRFLIIDSDNASIRVLERVLGGYEIVNARTRNELNAEHFFRYPHESSALAIGTVFKGLYEESYLSTEWNNYFLDLLKNTHPSLQDGIPVGVPWGTTIAHKTGIIPTYPGYAWNDAGIIYGEQTDYVLVVINSYVTIPDARSNIQQISRVVYEALN